MSSTLENALVNIETQFENKSLNFYDATKPPFRLYGVYKEDGLYRRLPYSVAEATSPAVASLSQKTSGGRLRFVVKGASHIAIHVEGPGQGIWDVSPITGYHSFDMYKGTGYSSVSRPVTAKSAHEHMFWADPNVETLITLNFPLAGTVSDLFIGLDPGAVVTPAPDYSLETPILFYGSSITMGMCASRPGMIYQNHLSRWLDFNYTNLGFSGAAKAEPAISKYVSEQECSIFVYDYDHNAQTPEYLEKTHEKMFLEFRSTHPDTPVLFMTRPNRSAPGSVLWDRVKIVERTYQNALDRGDKNVWFIPGNDLLAPELEGNYNVDGSHPNDLGFFSMANAIKPVLKEMIDVVKARGIK